MSSRSPTGDLGAVSFSARGLVADLSSPESDLTQSQNPNQIYWWMIPETCYVCLQKENKDTLFMDPIPCDCRRSITIKIHLSCLKN